MIFVKYKIVESLYKTHEKPSNNEFMLYPMNSLSSIFYLLPVIKTNPDFYIGQISLFGLSFASMLWWAQQTERSHYLDLFFLSSTLISTFSFITGTNSIVYVLPLLCFLKDKAMYNKIIVIFMLSLSFCSVGMYIKTMYLLAMIFKISDTYWGNPYGTALFHIFSSLSLLELVQSK